MRTLEIVRADVFEDDLTVMFAIAACLRDLGEFEESVVETADSVTVEYRAVSIRNDCGFTPVITLSGPLGDRVLIDASDNQPIPLTRMPPSAGGNE